MVADRQAPGVWATDDQDAFCGGREKRARAG